MATECIDGEDNPIKSPHKKRKTAIRISFFFPQNAPIKENVLPLSKKLSDLIGNTHIFVKGKKVVYNYST